MFKFELRLGCAATMSAECTIFRSSLGGPLNASSTAGPVRTYRASRLYLRASAAVPEIS